MMPQPPQVDYLKYEKYIDFATKNKNAAPDTQANYRNALKTCKIEGFDPSKVSEVWQLLLEQFNQGVSYGAIRNVLILTKAILNLHGIAYIKDYYYHELVAKIGKAGTIPEGYSEEQLREILRICQKEDWNLFRICIQIIYGGYRIKATAQPRYTDFTKVDPYDVHVVTVTSKGRTYVAAMSSYAYKLLEDTNFNHSNFVVEREPDWKDYAKNYRTRFIYALQKNGYDKVLEKKAPFNSMRKFFLQQLANSGLHDEDVGLLKGTVPKSIAWKKYINSKDGGLYPRIARLYSETSMATLRLV